MGRSTPPRGFETIHRILGSAMRAADRAASPEPPHLGGPLPVLSSRMQLLVGVRLAEVPARIASDLEGFRALVRLATRVLDGERLDNRMLDGVSKPSKSDEPALRFAKLVARAANHYLWAPPSARNAVGTSLETAAAAVVPVVSDVGEWLARIDRELVRGELEELLAARELVATSPIARVLARPAGRNGKLGCALARLDGGRFGLFVKLKARWEWHEGDRDHVFATVPEDYMAMVVDRFA